jgi:hypothetical protein
MTDKMRTRPNRFEVQSNSVGDPYIDDDDFNWDALLKIDGDFGSDAEKRRYMTAIAAVLSAHEDEIPYRSAEPKPPTVGGEQ